VTNLWYTVYVHIFLPFRLVQCSLISCDVASVIILLGMPCNRIVEETRQIFPFHRHMYSQYRKQIYKSGTWKRGRETSKGKRKVLNRGTSLWTPGGKEILSNRGFRVKPRQLRLVRKWSNLQVLCSDPFTYWSMLTYITYKLIYAWALKMLMPWLICQSIISYLNWLQMAVWYLLRERI
jgi:hypothetical protein